MGRKLTKHVHVFDAANKLHSFAPGDDLPKWAEPIVKNPAVFAGDAEPEPPAAGAQPAPSAATSQYAGLSKADLAKLCAERDLPTRALNKTQLTEALEAADAAAAAVSTASGSDGNDGPVELESATREELEQIAAAEGVTFEPDASDSELVQFIENERG